MTKKAILMVNVGTPDKPEKKYVRKYLTEFLNDPRVIDIPWLLCKILVNGIIIPFRVSHSTKLYQRLWFAEGSPLLIYLNKLTSRIEQLSANEYDVYRAMRYGNPSLKDILNEIAAHNYSEITVLPLFPQYASSTSGTVLEQILKFFSKQQVIPGLKIIPQFYSHPAFIDVLAHHINDYKPELYRHIIFSYHGLPLRHIQKIHAKGNCENCNCEIEMPPCGNYCYKATSYATSRLLAQKLNLAENQYTTTFQSRLTKKWLSPFTDETIVKLGRDGKDKILVVAPSFVADCLETIDEIGIEYKKLFYNSGGKELTLVSCLNEDEKWAGGIIDMIRNY